MRFAQSILLLSLFAVGATQAGPLRDLIKERRAERQAARAEAQSATQRGARQDEGQDELAGLKVTRNLAYGPERAQRLDVYTPQAGAGPHAPVILMVHGGGWRHGDKTMQTVVGNKAARWAARGFVLVSIDYRLLPEADVPTQEADVARAVAYVQAHAGEWGGDGRQLILMGHSAGAHLVSLLTASPRHARDHGVQAWLGTVALDSAAFDIPAIMGGRHFKLYDEAFGTDPALWRALSPIDQLTGPTPPLLAVCSSQRASSCEQARAYARKTTGLGNRAEVLPEDLSHREINERLGQEGAYTTAVERFMKQLAPGVAALLE